MQSVETHRDTAQTSRLLTDGGFRHAFFTRHGGVSEGAFASLNFSVAVGDAPERVAENLLRAARALGTTVERLYFLSQVHGDTVITVGAASDRNAVLHLEGDAIVSHDAGVACGVRVADCVPILVGDTSTGAALAIHAGWRGAVRGVVARGVRRLRALGPSNERHLLAAIGPHIRVGAFEVGDDVAREIDAACPEAEAIDRTRGPKPHVDLERVVRAQLRRAGLSDETIDTVPGCTATDADFFSFRRDGSRSGRHLAAIVARGA